MNTVYAVMDQSTSEYWPPTLESIHATRESAEALCAAVKEAHRKYTAEMEKGDPSGDAFSLYRKTLMDLGIQETEGDVYVSVWEVKP